MIKVYAYYDGYQQCDFYSPTRIKTGDTVRIKDNTYRVSHASKLDIDVVSSSIVNKDLCEINQFIDLTIVLD